MNILAYIDPGTTALIWQILAGILISLGVVLGIWWKKISTFFRSIWVKIFGQKKKNAVEDENSDEMDEIDQNLGKTDKTEEEIL